MNFMAADVFSRLQERYLTYTAQMDDPALCDPEIVKAIVTVNSHPGLVTIFSCQGHIKTRNGQGAGSLMCGVRDQEALNALFRFQQRLMHLRGHAYSTQLVTENKRDVTKRETGPNAASYPVWTLRWIFSQNELPTIYQHVNHAADAILEITR